MELTLIIASHASPPGYYPLVQSLVTGMTLYVVNELRFPSRICHLPDLITVFERHEEKRYENAKQRGWMIDKMAIKSWEESKIVLF
jgi:hypothetical protein